MRVSGGAREREGGGRRSVASFRMACGSSARRSLFQDTIAAALCWQSGQAQVCPGCLSPERACGGERAPGCDPRPQYD